ncbi:A24 family peptidase [Tessaracoccus defluvii]|uniref:Prepilin peptidase n=1 Tax=Tessaracoccus defluvii TaxID=1285901 RepID=A0A7H0H5Q4_9ACTN|nr:A24 family peptidase [Tessaracoccus defluvii]QNP55870.1 prepilin peptidase [Tessaracoccus defluvii]
MSGYDPLLTAALAVLGAAIGLMVRWPLDALRYRRDDEVGEPPPGSRWWLPLATAAASGLIACRFGVERWPLLLPTLPLAWFGPWLSAIDLDVRRLPNRLLSAHGVVVAVGVGAAALISGDLNIAIQAAVGGLVAFVVFWILDRVRPGGFGWGDGKYILIIGAATAAVSLSVAWWAFLIACLASGRPCHPVPPPASQLPLRALASCRRVGRP